MQTLTQATTTDKVKKALGMGFSIMGLSKVLSLSRPTVYKRMEDNSWSDSEIKLLQSKGIIR